MGYEQNLKASWPLGKYLWDPCCGDDDNCGRRDQEMPLMERRARHPSR